VAEESTKEVAPHAGADNTRTTWSGVFARARAGHFVCVTGPTLSAASAFGSVHGVLHSTALAVAGNVLAILALVFWLGLAHWVYRDAARRLDDRVLVLTATALGVVVPFVGPVIYMLFRPPETLEDIRAREIELAALSQRVARRESVCPVCRTGVEPGFLVCPVCTTQLKQPCAHCAAPLERLWQVCPYCATPVGSGGADLDAALTAEARSNGKAPATKTPRKRTAARRS
jgi:hypothetical protein